MARTSDLLDDQRRLAQLYFRAGEYDKAVAAYSKCIRMITQIATDKLEAIRVSRGLSPLPLVGSLIHPDLGSLLDQRSATLQKLGNLQDALADARRLVEVEPLGCKGYLRVGKLLLANDEPQKAYRNFQTAIYIISKAQKKYNIEVPQKLFETIKLHYRELNNYLKSEMKASRKASPSQSHTDSVTSAQDSKSSIRLKTEEFLVGPNGSLPPLNEANRILLCPARDLKRTRTDLGVDPFLALSPEILEEIFMHVPLKTVLLCQRVSKRWYKVLLMMPRVYVSRLNFKSRITLTEFYSGLKLVRSVTEHSFSRQAKQLRVRSFLNQAHLQKSLESLITIPGLDIKSLDLFDRYLSIQLLLGHLAKNGWRLNNLQRLDELKLAIGTCVRFPDIILSLFKKLRVLCLLVVLPSLSAAYNDYVPSSDKRFKQLQHLQSSPQYEALQVLVYANHPKLMPTTIEQTTAIGPTTFDPYPIFLNCQFPNLKELSVASCDFSNHLPQFGTFLTNSCNLVNLVLENNCGFTMLQFLHMLKNYLPKFCLARLTFRESAITSAQSLNEISESDLPQLNLLSHLDILGCSLSFKGLLKLLRIVNMDGSLKSLNIGQSSFLQFRTDSFQNPRSLASLLGILEICPNLSSLCLCDMELDNRTMKQFRDDFEVFGHSRVLLKSLDLSFCHKIEGYGLIDLFSAYPTQNLRLQKKGSSPSFSVENLIIDGLEVNQNTLHLLKKYGYAKKIINDPTKQKWRSFGNNSLVIS